MFERRKRSGVGDNDDFFQWLFSHTLRNHSKINPIFISVLLNSLLHRTDFYRELTDWGLDAS